MNFRIAKPNDISTLNTISIRSKGHWGYPSSWLEHWKDDLTLDEAQLRTQNVLVIEEDGQIIGFSSITENEQVFEILHLWVLPEYIGKGYGKKLLERIISTYANQDKPIIVEADPNAEPFYKSQGFTTFDKIESFPKGRFLPVMKRVANYTV